MNNKTNILYVLLLLVAISVILFMGYLFIGTYHNVPLSSLLALVPKTTSINPQTSPASLMPSTGAKQTSIQKITLPNGLASYTIRGKFVTQPTYNVRDVLQSYFVIDGDPSSNQILVIMTSRTGKINVGRSKGSLDGVTMWKIEDTESLRKSIKVNAPAQLRINPNMSGDSKTAIYIENVLNGMMNGNWSMPDNFNLNPPMVGVVM